MFHRLGRHHNRDNTVQTPPWLAQRFYDIVKPVLRPSVVLDPCVGPGNLIRPWREVAHTIGVDLADHSSTLVDEFHRYSFHAYSEWLLPKPDLVVCNPPWCRSTDKAMYPEIFARSIFRLFTSEIPLILLVPFNFRNCSHFSKRRAWLRNNAPEITSIMSLPIDCFPDTVMAAEVLVFNIPGLKPHYWL